jgi:hypothetical protein
MASTKVPLSISKTSKLVLLMSGAVSMIGCGFSWMAPRDTNPVIQDYTSPAIFRSSSVNIFATTASRRLAVFREVDTGVFVSCAEPSPDVGEVFAEAIAAGLKASAEVSPVSGGTGSGELAAEFGRAVATQIAPLLYRTQGLQLYRDAIYKLCIDRMNNWITQEKYDLEREEKFAKTVSLIEKELPLIAVGAFFSNVKAGNAQENVNELIKLLEEMKKILATKVEPTKVEPTKTGTTK